MFISLFGEWCECKSIYIRNMVDRRPGGTSSSCRDLCSPRGCNSHREVVWYNEGVTVSQENSRTRMQKRFLSFWNTTVYSQLSEVITFKHLPNLCAYVPQNFHVGQMCVRFVSPPVYDVSQDVGECGMWCALLVIRHLSISIRHLSLALWSAVLLQTSPNVLGQSTKWGNSLSEDCQIFPLTGVSKTSTRKAYCILLPLSRVNNMLSRWYL